MPAACRAQFLAQHRPPPEIQLECRGEHEEYGRLGSDRAINHAADREIARILGRPRRQTSEFNSRIDAKSTRREVLEMRRLDLSSRPGSMFRPQIGRNDEDGSGHDSPGQILNFPPSLPFFVIVATTSTIDRAANRDVTSALS